MSDNFLSPEVWSWRREMANQPKGWQDRPAPDPYMDRPQAVASQWVPDRLSQRLPIAFDNVLSAASGGNSRFNTDMAHRLSNYLRYASPFGPAAEAVDAIHRSAGLAYDGRWNDAANDLWQTAASYGAKRLGVSGQFLSPYVNDKREYGTIPGGTR